MPISAPRQRHVILNKLIPTSLYTLFTIILLINSLTLNSKPGFNATGVIRDIRYGER